MAVVLNAFFEERVEHLFALAKLVEEVFSAAGLEYRVVGGLATYLYMEEAEQYAGPLTRDVDVAVRREDLAKIAAAAEPFGLKYRHVAGMDMLLQVDQPTARLAVHMLFAGEKVRPADPEPVPEMEACRWMNQIRLIPLADLVRMKLISFRAKDEGHINSLDEVGLITPEIESQLSEPLRERLAQARARAGR